jgi:predicted permease
LAGSFNVVTSSLPVSLELNLETDLRMLMYSAALTIVATLVCGLVPARGASRFDVVSSLKDSNNGATGPRRMRRALVVGQVAASAALLIWSGLFLRSLGRINDVNPGFDPTGVLLAGIELERNAGEPAERILVELQQRIADLPAVESAGLAKIVPLAMAGREEFDVSIADHTPYTPRRVTANRLSPGWFDAVRIPFIAGRDFTSDDRQGAPMVVIVNETLARQFWNGDALGKRITYRKQPVEVVGVVRDSKYWTLGEEITPTVYLPFRQETASSMTLHIRTADSKAATSAVLREMQRLAPAVPVEIEPMTEAVSVAVLPARIGAAATGAFGILAILLSALGVYGLVSFLVVQRTREIALRRALGAGTADIVRAVVGSSATLTIAGLAGGVGVGVLGGLALQGFIFGVSPLDLATLLGAASVVMAAALLASVVPALTAVRVDPIVALRD